MEKQSNVGRLKLFLMYYTMQGNDVLYAGIGLWQSSSNKQAPAVVALNPSNGDILWTKVLGMEFVAG